MLENYKNVRESNCNVLQSKQMFFTVTKYNSLNDWLTNQMDLVTAPLQADCNLSCKPPKQL